ncbi:MAG: DUF1287 domain-containing protein [Candidatus Accumulibacter sp.]|nr:DUF1287 domain-containing protein [Accumulibacter sp.]
MIRRLCTVLFFLTAAADAQENFYARLAHSAENLTKQTVRYDPAYFRMPYPNGDVPADRGVCTDVVIRAYRKAGIDLQKEVHEDMKANFSRYPKLWGMKTTDTHIDHRRVPNLMTFFSRRGAGKKISSDPRDYQPGDIVFWDLGGGVKHVGLVANKKSTDGKRHLIVHNVGHGQVLEDFLFQFTVIGHHRYRK